MKKLLLLCVVLVATALNFDASAQKQKKEKAPPKTVNELVEQLGNIKGVVDKDINAFTVASVKLVRDFKKMSDEWQNIKIEVTEVEDEGDGVTTAVKITDVEGNPRTKDEVTASNVQTGLNLTNMALQATNLGMSGANLISATISDPSKLIVMAVSIKQMKLCIEALSALAREIPVFAENVKTQNALIAQSKQI